MSTEPRQVECEADMIFIHVTMCVGVVCWVLCNGVLEL